MYNLKPVKTVSRSAQLHDTPHFIYCTKIKNYEAITYNLYTEEVADARALPFTRLFWLLFLDQIIHRSLS
ncbi:hypothetical protein CRH01_14730 [Chryseobacterium rhizosphaerae]|nr:hypothetical protein CRH01_14730 [Chryseobacterium rhizosphaerae]